MSVHAARALIGWRLPSGSCHNYCVSLRKGVRTMSLPGFVLKSMYPEEDGSHLSSGYTMVLPYRVLLRLLKTFIATQCVLINYLVTWIYFWVLSEKDNFYYFYFIEIHWGGWSSPSCSEEPPPVRAITNSWMITSITQRDTFHLNRSISTVVGLQLGSFMNINNI